MGEGEGGGVMSFQTRAILYMALACLSWAALAVIGSLILSARSHPLAALLFLALVGISSTPFGLMAIIMLLFKARGMKDD